MWIKNHEIVEKNCIIIDIKQIPTVLQYIDTVRQKFLRAPFKTITSYNLINWLKIAPNDSLFWEVKKISSQNFVKIEIGRYDDEKSKSHFYKNKSFICACNENLNNTLWTCMSVR